MAGCEITGTSSSFVSMLFLLSTGPPSLPLTPGPPPFLLSTSAVVIPLASLLTSVLSRYYPWPARSSLAWCSLPGSLALALALASAVLAMTCLERLQPSVYRWCSLALAWSLEVYPGRRCCGQTHFQFYHTAVAKVSISSTLPLPLCACMSSIPLLLLCSLCSVRCTCR